MSAVFADTSYFIALVNPADAFHSLIRDRTPAVVTALVTTEWVLVELANFLCRTDNRRLFVSLFEELRKNPQVHIVPATTEIFEQGVAYFKARPDKDWSLTDCISFLVMKRERIAGALTLDHHFEQAGFTVLLKQL